MTDEVLVFLKCSKGNCYRFITGVLIFSVGLPAILLRDTITIDLFTQTETDNTEN